MVDRRKRFRKARSFANYYGKGHIEKLAHYDIVIVEPTAHTDQEIRSLQQTETLVLAYVTIMELGSFHGMYPMLKEEDFLIINGEKYYKPMFDTYVLDLKSKRWRGLLHHHVGSLLMKSGYDGVFMDTIGDVEDPVIPLVESKLQINQAVEITRGLRQSFPNHVIVQNNGLERLCEATGPYIDGLCWENPLFAHQESLEWCEAVMKRIVRLKEEYGVRSLFLHESNEVKQKPTAGIMAQAIADKHEFLYYEAPDYYLSLP